MGIVTNEQIKASASRAGFIGPDINTIAAIANAESNRNVSATTHEPNGTTSYGVYQINSIWLGNTVDGTKVTVSNLHDLDFSSKVAYYIFKKSGFNAWTTYKTGVYKKYLTDVSSTSVDNATILSPSTMAEDTGYSTSATYATNTGVLSDDWNKHMKDITKIFTDSKYFILGLVLLALGATIYVRSFNASIPNVGKVTKKLVKL